MPSDISDMNLPDLLDILPVQLASGVALIVTVTVLVAYFRAMPSGEEPIYLQRARITVILALFLAYLILTALGVYLVIAATFRQF